MTQKSMEKIVSLAKTRGFVFPGSEIYGGLANTWDYGPLGVEFKNNVKKAWWKKFIQESPYNVGVDAAILMNPQTWVASGHVGGFNDPLMDCKDCKTRYRADKLIEDYFMEFRMNTRFVAFDHSNHLGETATHPLARLVARLSLSLLLAYPGKPRRRFALKDSDPLRAEARVESYAADTRPDAPSGASNCGF